MSGPDPKLSDLPDDLQNLVFEFAYDMRKAHVMVSLRICIEITHMNLPFFFYRDRLWSWHYKRMLPNPVHEFMPIEYYSGSFRDIFDDDSIYCFLLGLDFRMKNVKCFGNRWEWEHRLCRSWRCVEALASFYNMLLRSKTRILRKKDTFRKYVEL